MNSLFSWTLKILSLLPLIAQGVHAVQTDLSPTGLNSKLAAAQDALNFASAGSIALLPSEDQPKAQEIAAVASAGLAATVTALHTAQKATPAIA